MATYLLTYRNPKVSGPPESDPMAEWNAWFQRISRSLVDAGNPIFSRETLGTVHETDLGGYSLVSADSLDEAVELAKGSPAMREGGGVEVGEITNLDSLRTVTKPAAVGGSGPAGPAADYANRVRIRASADRVFNALTSPEGLSGWWTPATGSGLKGGELRFWFGDDDPLVIAVETARRPTEVAWHVLAYQGLPDWVGTRPRFHVTELADGVSEVVFEHTGLTPQLECFEMCRLGWDFYLPSLRDYVETGVGRPGPGAGSTQLAGSIENGGLGGAAS